MATRVIRPVGCECAHCGTQTSFDCGSQPSQMIILTWPGNLKVLVISNFANNGALLVMRLHNHSICIGCTLRNIYRLMLNLKQYPPSLVLSESFTCWRSHSADAQRTSSSLPCCSNLALPSSWLPGSCVMPDTIDNRWTASERKSSPL